MKNVSRLIKINGQNMLLCKTKFKFELFDYNSTDKVCYSLNLRVNSTTMNRGYPLSCESQCHK